MVTIILHCPHCQSQALVRNGHAPNGKQRQTIFPQTAQRAALRATGDYH